MKELRRMLAGFYIIISVFTLLSLGGCEHWGGRDRDNHGNYNDRGDRGDNSRHGEGNHGQFHNQENRGDSH